MHFVHIIHIVQIMRIVQIRVSFEESFCARSYGGHFSEGNGKRNANGEIFEIGFDDVIELNALEK